MSRFLVDVVAVLERIAPPALAEDWDNVGLLVDTIPPQQVNRCLLTIDLTEAVLDEAIAKGCELIVSYHPPIFAALRRLRHTDPKERILLRAIRAGIAIHTPHTALDATAAGLNDWLADGLGPGRRTALAPAGEIGDTPPIGQGRLVELDQPMPFDALVARIKAHLGIAHLRVARRAAAEQVFRVALCAGAGAAVLMPHGADVYWTGEMRHHDVLAALARGTSVVLCEHSSSERGFLAVLARRLSAELDDVTIEISSTDTEPLQFV